MNRMPRRSGAAARPRIQRSAPARRSRRPLAISLGLLVAAMTMPLASCSDSAAPAIQGPSTTGPYHGTYLPGTFAKPDITLTDTSGKPFNLATETAGHPTLLYFGYSHCPDVCPTTMANLAAAVHRLPDSQQEELRVVFITTDPRRDTPPVLRRWLNAFDSAFIGLTGDFGTIQQAAYSVGVTVEPPVKHPDGTITSTHGAYVLGYFASDNKAHVLYHSDEVSPDDYAQDLPLIIKETQP